MIVSDEKGPAGNLLVPYPEWSWYEADNCSGITSVYRIMVLFLFFFFRNLTIYVHFFGF